MNNRVLIFDGDGVSSKDFIISETKFKYCRKYGTLGGLLKEEENANNL